jgi:hypothetical protein
MDIKTRPRAAMRRSLCQALLRTEGEFGVRVSVAVASKRIKSVETGSVTQVHTIRTGREERFLTPRFHRLVGFVQRFLVRDLLSARRFDDVFDANPVNDTDWN